MKKLIITIALIATSFAASAQHCGHCHHSAPTPKVIAHRGYWDFPGSAQNSIRALQLADSVGAYASEFDIWMTADSVLVVNHDRDINGLVIQDSQSSDILAQKLANGENVPTLNDFLDAAVPLKVNLVLEVKEHKTPEANIEATRRAIAMIREKGLYDRTDYISFSPYAFETFIKEAPGREASFLYELIGPERIKELGGTGIDYNIGHFWSNNNLTKECHDLGLKVNIWTVDSDDDITFSIDQGVDYITTNRPVRCAELIRQSHCSQH